MKALLFDVFGTVVDWRGSVIAAGEALTSVYGLSTDWGRFADEWRRDGYLRPLGQIVTGAEPYREVDVLMREQLDAMIGPHGLSRVREDDMRGLELVWDRLQPWPDVVAGLTSLKTSFTIAPLSNGGFAQLTSIAKRAGLPWDCIISTSLFGAYKPDPRTYRGAADLLELDPSEVMLVAAHPLDLRGAQHAGMRTAYVPRPFEWGPNGRPPEPPDPTFEVVAADFNALADALGL